MMPSSLPASWGLRVTAVPTAARNPEQIEGKKVEPTSALGDAIAGKLLFRPGDIRVHSVDDPCPLASEYTGARTCCRHGRCPA